MGQSGVGMRQSGGRRRSCQSLLQLLPPGFWGLEFFLLGNRVLLNGEAWREGKDLQN